MVVGTDQQEEGKERDIKKEGVMGEREREGIWKREGKSKSKLKKEGYSYRGTPQASNSGGYMNSLLLLFLSLSSLHPSLSPSLPLSLGERHHSQCGPGVIRVDPALSLSAFILSPSFIPSFLFLLLQCKEGGNKNSHTSPKLIFY